MLWSSLSRVIPPSSSLLTFMVLSFFVSLKLQGLQRQVMPFGLISISFLNCNFPWQIGQLGYELAGQLLFLIEINRCRFIIVGEFKVFGDGFLLKTAFLFRGH